MKILLVAVNAKYIHSNLAVYSLRTCAARRLDADTDVIIDIAEYTINQQPDEVLKSLFKRNPDIICFSCYIWNLSFVENLIVEITKVLPETEIWMGGPEVSYDAEEVLVRLPQIRGVMMGEGEDTFTELCGIYAGCYMGSVPVGGHFSGYESGQADSLFLQTAGITFRDRNGIIHKNPWREPLNLDEIPFVYEDMREFEHKIIYYETSRGCPFSCSYCLSSVDKRLRFRSIGLVKRELQFFIDHEVPQVKFVDRTFNCKHGHAMEIWRYITEHDNGITNFHFEVAVDLLTEEELSLIGTMRPGLIQLEIGVQSVNPETIREIRRTMDFEKVKLNVERIRRNGNVLQHLDLIAGLPYEDIRSF